MRKSTNAPLRDLGAVLLVVCPLSPRVLADDGTIVFCGNQGDLPSEFGTATVHDHWPGYLLPGFVDSHIHFPQTYAGDSYAGGQLLEWLNLCVFPSEAKFADPEFAAQAAVEFINRRIAAGTTAATATPWARHDSARRLRSPATVVPSPHSISTPNTNPACEFSSDSR